MAINPIFNESEKTKEEKNQKNITFLYLWESSNLSKSAMFWWRTYESYPSGYKYWWFKVYSSLLSILF